MIKLKILFAPLSFYFSHISRCLSIAKVLSAKYDVEFIACAKYIDFIKNEGYKVHLVASGNEEKQRVFGAEECYQKRVSHLLAGMSYNFKQMIIDDFGVIRKIKPDILIFDGRVTAHLAAKYLNIPSVEIRNHVSVLTKYELMILSKCGTKKEYEFNICDIESSYQEIMNAIKILPEINFSNFLKTYVHPPVIIPGIEEFELAENINLFSERTCSFVGPLIWDGWKKWEQKIQYQKNKKNILITLGSTFPFKRTIDTIIDALNGDQYHLIINTGDNFIFSGDKGISPNCEIHQYLNLEETLNNVDLVIHHGGHGTAMLTLMAGKPCIVIPFNGDHIEISRIISKLKIGLRIKKYPEDITKYEILNAIHEILSNNIYKKNAEKLSFVLKNSTNSAIKAAEFIEQQIIQTIKNQRNEKNNQN